MRNRFFLYVGINLIVISLTVSLVTFVLSGDWKSSPILGFFLGVLCLSGYGIKKLRSNV